jgi:hypothetical protein
MRHRSSAKVELSTLNRERKGKATIDTNQNLSVEKHKFDENTKSLKNANLLNNQNGRVGDM